MSKDTDGPAPGDTVITDAPALPRTIARARLSSGWRSLRIVYVAAPIRGSSDRSLRARWVTAAMLLTSRLLARLLCAGLFACLLSAGLLEAQLLKAGWVWSHCLARGCVLGIDADVGGTVCG